MFGVGELIGGYWVISRLTHDDRSSLYLAEPTDEVSKGMVAIRVWEQGEPGEDGLYDSFLAEAGKLVQLRHPHMLLVFDYGIEQNKPYLVVEHYDPPLVWLTERLKQGPFTQEQAHTLLAQISGALHYAHQWWVAHGRLSPEYVYLDADDQAVLEFPLLMLSEVGSEVYRAPEQQNEGVLKSKLSDQYALAGLAHVLFTGHPLPVDQTLASTVPDAVRPIITKALAEQRLQRFKSIEDFSQALAHSTAEVQQLAQQATAPLIPPASSGMLRKGYKAVKRSRALQLLCLLVALLLALAIAGPLILRSIPASSAKVTITPASKHLKNLYTITAVPGVADAARHEIQVRHLKATGNASAPVRASGLGHEDAASATGKVTLSNVSQVVENVRSLTLTVRGVSAVIELTRPGTGELVSMRPGESYELNARIQQEGSFGNIPARFFDGDHLFFVSNFLGTNNFNFTVHIEHQASFSGGKNASDYTYLQKQDVDTVAQPIIKGLADSATRDVQQQIQPGEEPFVANSVAEKISCSVNHKGNKINDRVLDGTLVIEVTCEADAYMPEQAMLAANAWQKEDATRQLGAQYQLVGDVRTTLDKSQILNYGDVLHIPVATEGYWIYQFQTDQLRELAQSITGKTQEDGLTLLNHLPNVAQATLTTSGFPGSALPWSGENIQIIVTKVPGLLTD